MCGAASIAAAALQRSRTKRKCAATETHWPGFDAEAPSVAVSDANIQRLHALTRGQIWDAGRYKEKDGDIVERFADGT